MAENQDDQPREDLSDEPSPHRIEEMRKKGQVAQSRELTGLIALLATGTALYAFTPVLSGKLSAYMQDLFQVQWAYSAKFDYFAYLAKKAQKGLEILLYVGLPIAFVAFVIGAAGSFVQIGSVFSTDPLNPDISRINPVQGMKRFLSLRQLYDGVRLVFKGFTVALIAYFLIKSEIISASKFTLIDPNIIPNQFADSGIYIFFALCGVLLIFAGFDFWLQRWEYSKKTRLTKKEAKEELKEREGDPLIKARIRAVQKEMARKRMMEAVKTADVVVTNPTHIAVAVKYNALEMDAPKVVAKGGDFLAQKIKKIAGEAGVPMVENVPLARTLYKSVKVGQHVPRVLYKAVAEVLAYVFRLKGKRS